MDKKLYRSTTNRILAGVAGGLGEYFDIDPWIIRIFFILMHAAGLLIYIVLAIFVPESSAHPSAKAETLVTSTISKSFRRPGGGQTGQWIGAALIILGALFLLDTLNLTYMFWPLVKIRDLWLPVLIIFGGVFFLTRRQT